MKVQIYLERRGGRNCGTARTFKSIISRSFSSVGVGAGEESFSLELAWSCSAAGDLTLPLESASAVVE